ncbi:hypothetical protein NQ315_003545 [Exocentrus adspersus]|uniref:Uncharacterized protein n=1 Tax=Exocentrus adspersus TaxID=1586481 RepID=A0AAV8VCZ1_9CUCU|nr:hypothetical protein NQ315_003545 [Exocentrus adspersus]
MEDSMKQLMEMLSAMKEDMKRGQEEMKASQEEVKVSQEGMKEDSKASQEKLLQEMKTAMEENNTNLETKLHEFEQVVEEEINFVKDDVKAVKEEMNKKIEDLETKFRQLSTTTVVRNWREEEKATSLIAALRGEALEVLRIIPEGSQDYKAVTSALEKRYGDAHLWFASNKLACHVYQTQLRNRRQRFEETLQQYEADVS